MRGQGSSPSLAWCCRDTTLPHPGTTQHLAPDGKPGAKHLWDQGQSSSIPLASKVRGKLRALLPFGHGASSQAGTAEPGYNPKLHMAGKCPPLWDSSPNSMESRPGPCSPWQPTEGARHAWSSPWLLQRVRAGWQAEAALDSTSPIRSKSVSDTGTFVDAFPATVYCLILMSNNLKVH